MKIAILAPSSAPFVIGGAERLWWGLLDGINQLTPHDADLIKLPSPEWEFWDLMESYRAFSRLDLRHFDLVISTKYPAWMVEHPNHCVYMQHRLRGLYDTYHFTGLPAEIGPVPAALRPLLGMMDRSRGDRAELEPFLDLLFGLRGDATIGPDVFVFPGPLVRRIVRFLDGIALGPRAIRRYCAISRTVALREDYFPPGAAVNVIHHPSNLPWFENTGYAYLFTASRLEGPKRLDLLIQAFQRVTHGIELRIAGKGPAEDDLKALARDDPRIRFLGRIDDEALSRQYAGALFVPFVPYDEDYGLIAVEAMASGKAVATVSDAGGVTELVTEGVTGRIAEPDPDSLGRVMEAMIADADGTRAMGKQARERVSPIHWAATLQALIGESIEEATDEEPEIGDVDEAAGPMEWTRKSLVVTVDFPVYPPRSGGQARIFHLYRSLARYADVTLVTLCDDPPAAGTYELAPGLKEVRVAKSERHLAEQAVMDSKLGASVGDITTMLYWERTPEYARVLATEAKDCDLLIASHPYLYPVLQAHHRGPVWYEAHNVELDMKRAVLAESTGAESFLDHVRRTEQALCAAADRIIVCSDNDAERLAQLYAIDYRKCLIVPNGVDTRAVQFSHGSQRLAAKSRLGLDGRFVAVYMGSWHQPNLEGLRYLKSIAADCPDVDFLVIGSLCHHPEAKGLSGNLNALGLLEDAELDALLAAADLALNPVTSGSGTNVKMLHYAAAGVPVLSAPFGNRGLGFAKGTEVFIADTCAFAATIEPIRHLSPTRLGAMAARARARVEVCFDWRAIAQCLAGSLRASDVRDEHMTPALT